MDIVPKPSLRHLAYSMMIGLGIGALFMLLLVVVRNKIKRRKMLQVPANWTPKPHQAPEEVNKD